VAEWIDRFPLFPLGLVLLPGEVVPLHIYEEPYKVMVNHCLDTGSQFGIIWRSDEGLQPIGCSAEVTQLLDRTDEGRMNILIQGAKPFKVVRQVKDMDYPAGDVQLLEEESGAVGDPRAGAAARHSYADLVERVTDTRPSEADLAELDSYGMAATIAFELEAKQSLLELRSEPARLERLTEMLQDALERYEQSEKESERAAARAKTNGKVRR
jgi:Lon protease-like protein